MYAQILDGLGDRPLGLEADQLVIEIARWIKGRAGVGKLRLKASGISSQVAATVAAALKPDFLAHVVVHSGMPSLRFVLDAPLNFQEAPDLFCLDLYKDFDLDRLAAMVAPATLTVERHVEVHRNSRAARQTAFPSPLQSCKLRLRAISRRPSRK